MNLLYGPMPKDASSSTTRIQWLDSLRGIAIVLMVIFHFCYDLRYFGWVSWDTPNGSGWWQFRYVILTLFIFTMGMSLSLAHQKRFKPKKFFVRALQLALAASVVTAMSLLMFPSSWIYFGILHFLLMASLIAIVFIKTPLASLIIGAGIIVLFWLGILDARIPFVLFEQYLPDNTEDFVPFFPWLGVCLIGLAATHYLPLQKIEQTLPKLPKSLNFLGRHGLIIYIIHQPILFALLTPLSLIKFG